MKAFRFLAALVVVTSQLPAQGARQAARDSATTRAKQCPPCAEWNAPQKPLLVFGNTWYVGTHGLSALLITSNGGHVLIDGGLPESAPIIAANIVTLGFRMQDVKLIVNSHDHYDHAGGISELQHKSGARVAASASSARALKLGDSEDDDPQFGTTLPFPKVANVSVIRDNDTLRVGEIAVVAHFTPGHTPGGTSWTWRSCQDSRCLDLVYADSQSPISADGFLFTKSQKYPSAIRDFEKGFADLEKMRCDILVTPHPDASQLWQRLARRESGSADAMIDAAACGRYAETARQRLAARIAAENRKP